MNFRDIDKDIKYFILIGIPCLIFLVFIFFTHYLQISIFFLMIRRPTTIKAKVKALGTDFTCKKIDSRLYFI